MIARKCDICKKYYDNYDGYNNNKVNANAIIFVDIDITDSYATRDTYDLCPNCMNSIIKTLGI